MATLKYSIEYTCNFKCFDITLFLFWILMSDVSINYFMWCLSFLSYIQSNEDFLVDNGIYHNRGCLDFLLEYNIYKYRFYIYYINCPVYCCLWNSDSDLKVVYIGLLANTSENAMSLYDMGCSWLLMSE